MSSPSPSRVPEALGWRSPSTGTFEEPFDLAIRQVAGGSDLQLPLRPPPSEPTDDPAGEPLPVGGGVTRQSEQLDGDCAEGKANHGENTDRCEGHPPVQHKPDHEQHDGSKAGVQRPP